MYTIRAQLAGGGDWWHHLLGFGIVLRPEPDKLIQVVGPQDGPIPRQVVKVIHDDGDKQVDNLRCG